MSTTTPPPPPLPAKETPSESIPEATHESTPESTLTTQSAPEPEPTFDRQIQMFQPPSNAPAKVELPESFFKLTANEIKSLYKSHVDSREKLENRPLKTQKIRQAEELDRMKKYPRTKIRIRFPDSTILQAVFKSQEKVGDVYDFVKSTLKTPERKFLLCLPPRSKLVEPLQTLYKAGLAPASNLTFVWIDKALSGQQGIYIKEYT
ncbi:hypothetical protein BDC45DRAFT_507569 [Circinella umbellata]|nr:hypothetical protein BDC45DRAFT_507569 [Circinella umbellata]